MSIHVTGNTKVDTKVV